MPARAPAKEADMLVQLRHRLTYANVISSIAVFIVLGGSAYATHRIGTNEIEDRAVTTAKLDRHAVTGSKVATNAIGKRMLRRGLVTGQEIRRGAVATGKLADEAVTRRKLAAGVRDGIQGPPGPSTGPAGGDLTGNYPDPSIRDGAVTTSKLADQAVTDAKVAAANKDGAAGTPSLRTLGGGAQQAMPGNATPGGPPTGSAGGALTGTYPNPSLNVSGGPCANGRALTNVSALAALTCAPGVYSDGNNNVAAGPTSFPNLTTGGSNSALGSGALFSNTTGSVNTALGVSALLNNTGGFENSALGLDALFSNTTGNRNTAVGRGALFGNTTGSDNTAVGRSALVLSTGENNTALGNSAGNNLTTGSNNIAIGNAGVGGDSNTTRIGSAQTRAFIAGIRDTAISNPQTVNVDPNGQLGIIPSSRRFKRDIEPLGAAKELMRLRPVSFRYREGPPALHYGLIAEQVERVLPTLVAYGRDGLPETVEYHELPALLLAGIQAQQRKQARQQRQIDSLRGRIARQQEQIRRLIRLAPKTNHR